MMTQSAHVVSFQEEEPWSPQSAPVSDPPSGHEEEESTDVANFLQEGRPISFVQLLQLQASGSSTATNGKGSKTTSAVGAVRHGNSLCNSASKHADTPYVNSNGGMGGKPSTSGCKRPRETDPHRLEQRQKQIDFGKNTLGYDRYIKTIDRRSRRKDDPMTPEKSQVCSKRSWDGQVRKWRRLLHVWDPTPVDGEEAPVMLDDLQVGDEDVAVEDSQVPSVMDGTAAEGEAAAAEVDIYADADQL